MEILTGKRRHDYDVSFRRSVKQLELDKLIAGDALGEVDNMIEGYLADVGETPSDDLLNRLTDVILGEDLRERDKSTLEHCILSETQLSHLKGRSRVSREVPLVVEEVDYLYHKYLDPSIYSTEIYPEEYYISKDNIRGYVSQRARGKQQAEQQKWAMSVKERDGFRCKNTNCNSRTGIMHAHHIRNYADYPEFRLEISNGITLCERCHRDFHSQFGNSRNTPEQLAEFMRDIPEITPA